MDTREELKKIKTEAEEQKNKERKEREEKRRETEKLIDNVAENFSKYVVSYFIEKRIAECNFEIILGWTQAKSPFNDARRITKEFVRIYNSLGSKEEKDYFFDSLKKKTKEKGILFENKFIFGGDFFFSAPDKYKVRFSII